MKKVFILLTTIVLVSSCSTFKSETKKEIASSENKITRNIASCDSVFRPGKFLDYTRQIMNDLMDKGNKWWVYENKREAFQLIPFQDDKIIFKGNGKWIYTYVGNGMYRDLDSGVNAWVQFDCPEDISRLRVSVISSVNGKIEEVTSGEGYGYEDFLFKFLTKDAWINKYHQSLKSYNDMITVYP